MSQPGEIRSALRQCINRNYIAGAAAATILIVRQFPGEQQKKEENKNLAKKISMQLDRTAE